MATSVSSIMSATASAVMSSTPPASTNRAPNQSGILDGGNPSIYDPKNPIIMFIIQVGIIVIFCRLLHYPLSRLRQPRVIAEVIGGIILGPSVMMRIPGFQEHIFPTASMATLSAVANLALILFLFLVGLEVNIRLLTANWRVAASVGLAGMLLPFGLGCALSWGLYNQFRHDPGTVPIDFPVYMLFIGTAISITAFPVLCRILTELKLLGTTVGITVLAAGISNDVTGWILLALCVALVNNGSGIVALYVLLTAIGWILFLVFAVRPNFIWLLRRTGSIQNGPTQTMIAVTLLLVLTSAWFTGIIGIHPIFGAFLVGLICPHEGGFAIKVTEKIEDLVSVLLLPLYFALSGLSTNLGMLNDGITWGYVIAIIVVAFSGKIIGGTLAARACKMLWRESFSVGALMSCKGLVELIVLNIGLQAKILSTRTFTMFVVMALVTTISTTPLTMWLYPPAYQQKLEAWKRGEIDWDGNPSQVDEVAGNSEKRQSTQVRRLLIYLRLDSLPGLFTFVTLLGGDRSMVVTKTHKSKVNATGRGSSTEHLPIPEPNGILEVHGVRLLELTERTSSVMKVSEGDELTYRDPVVNTFCTFGQLNNVAVSGAVSIVPESSYAETLARQAADQMSDLLLIPWGENNVSEGDASNDVISSATQEQLIQRTLDTTACNAAIFINRGFGVPSREPRALTRATTGLSIRSYRAPSHPITDRSHHIYFPYFGGADDHVALRFVLQLARNSNITATIAHFIQTAEVSPEIRGNETAARAQAAHNSDIAFIHSLRDSLPEELAMRVVFVETTTGTPLADCIEHSRQEIGQSPKNAGDLIVVGRSRDSALWAAGAEGSTGSEIRRALGGVVEALASENARSSVLVVQAGR